MITGGILGILKINIPFVETGIIMSVIILGLIIASGKKFSEFVAIVAVSLFALFHGHAHGSEMPITASAFYYALGFIVSTILLHISGILIGAGIQRNNNITVYRIAGGFITLIGIYMAINA